MLNRLRTYSCLLLYRNNYVVQVQFHEDVGTAERVCSLVSLEGNTQVGVISIAWGLGVLDCGNGCRIADRCDGILHRHQGGSALAWLQKVIACPGNSSAFNRQYHMFSNAMCRLLTVVAQISSAVAQGKKRICYSSRLDTEWCSHFTIHWLQVSFLSLNQV